MFLVLHLTGPFFFHDLKHLFCLRVSIICQYLVSFFGSFKRNVGGTSFFIVGVHKKWLSISNISLNT